MPLQFHNTLTKKVEPFTSQQPGKVKLYTCGPTVYNYLHIGNWAAYIYWDTLVRTLTANGYTVERVMNITDVGHLTSDEDDGEDKMQKGAHREGKTAWDIAKLYGDDFVKGMEKLNLLIPQHVTKATDYIPQQLEVVRALKQKGYTYQIDDGIYYDTAKFASYADFASLDLEAQKAGARVTLNSQKRNPSDFALWKFTPAGEKRDMEWETPADLLEDTATRTTPARVAGGGQAVDSDQQVPASLGSAEQRVAASGAAPAFTDAKGGLKVGADSPTGPASAKRENKDNDWILNQVQDGRGKDKSGDATNHNPVMGFPGWHLECSAMAMDILGNTLDIHTGGIDHIPVHHTNEIAQSQAVSDVRFSNYWLHNNHIKSNGTKISKSLNNGYTLEALKKRGFSPIDYRMFILQGQYRNEGNFTFENLGAAQHRLKHWRNIAGLRHQTHDTLSNNQPDDPSPAAIGAIKEALANDLNTPEALRIIDQTFSRIESQPLSHIDHHTLTELLQVIDDLLGLRLVESTPDITDQQKQLILQRQRARDNKDWETSDRLRDDLLQQGLTVRDAAKNTIWAYK